MSSSKPTISTLPTELLFNILSYLPTYDILHNVALVSKKFYESSQSPFVHKIVTLKEVPYESENFLSKMTLTRELHIQQMYARCHDDDPIGDLLSIISNYSHLRAFMIYERMWSPGEIFKSFREAKWWRTLTKFNVTSDNHAFGGCERYHKDLGKSLSELGSEVQMTHFCVGIREEDDEEDPVCVTETLQHPRLKQLKNLTLHFYYSPEVLRGILLPMKNTLEELRMNFYSEYSKHSFEYDFLPELSKLRVLEAKISFSGLKVLPQLKHLTHLTIEPVQLYRKRKAKTVELTPGCMPTVTHLIISTPKSEFSDEWDAHDGKKSKLAMEIFEKVLPACPNLEDLNIRCDDSSILSFENIKLIRNMRTNLKNLKRFTLRASGLYKPVNMLTL